MTRLPSPLQEQTEADMNKRWSFLGLDFKKLAAWKSQGVAKESPPEKQPPTPTTSIGKSDRRTLGTVIIPTFGRVISFKRQQSELRDRLRPVVPSRDESRSASADRRTNTSRRQSAPALSSNIDLVEPPAFQTSLPSSPLAESHQFVDVKESDQIVPSLTVSDTVVESQATAPPEGGTPVEDSQDSHEEPVPAPPLSKEDAAQWHSDQQNANDRDCSTKVPDQPDGDPPGGELDHNSYHASFNEQQLGEENDQYLDDEDRSTYQQSLTDSQYDAMIHDELERKWILNLSMHFRDNSKREKFFVTYFQLTPTIKAWRRVTISLDYRGAPENSLELDLLNTKYQRDKSAKIYEAIRESLPDIHFYPTVTNLKIQTTDGRLHVHVVEDVNEIINFQSQRMVAHLGCRLIKESDIEFDSHMSGFVYKVKVKGRILIKKEVPGPDTVDEFLYEVNALNRLAQSKNVIEFYGVVVDDYEDKVKGLLISYAEKGALVDIIYDYDHTLLWDLRQKWAQQIVQGLAEIHEAGFVQGDFTLSNIVIDANDNAKIIDINRRGCPVGWEPPEATPLIESGQRISMYIGVKSDLFQLGMVLWALATQEDEPESHPRPLYLTVDDAPRWYCRIVEICLSEDPRYRRQASELLSLFEEPNKSSTGHHRPLTMSYSVSVDETSVQSFPNNQAYQYVEGLLDPEEGHTLAPRVTTISPPSDCSPSPRLGYATLDTPCGIDPGYKPQRGRSPPRDVFRLPGMPLHCSWQDNSAATGWESRSTTPCSKKFPQQKDAPPLEEHTAVLQRNIGMSPIADTARMDIGNLAVLPSKCTLEDAFVREELGAREAKSATDVSAIPIADGQDPATVVGEAKRAGEWQASEPRPDVRLEAGWWEPFVEEVRTSSDVNSGTGKEDLIFEKDLRTQSAVVDDPVSGPGAAETRADLDQEGNHSKRISKGLLHPPRSLNGTKAIPPIEGVPQFQEPGTMLHAIRVETFASQKQQCISDVARILGSTQPHPVRVLRDSGSSNTRTTGSASLSGALLSKEQETTIPVLLGANHENSIQNADYGHPSLLNGVGGSTEAPMDAKRTSGMFDDLDALVSESHSPTKAGHLARDSQHMPVAGKVA